MTSARVRALVGKLEKGREKTNAILGALTPAQWQQIVYEGPPAWTARDLLAHFASAEQSLLALAKNVAEGGSGLPEGFDFDAFNAQEQARLREHSPRELLAMLDAARQATLDWTRTLDEEHLDRVGRHPVLGDVSLETMLVAIYGHQLLHMRELQAQLKLE